MPTPLALVRRYSCTVHRRSLRSPIPHILCFVVLASLTMARQTPAQTWNVVLDKADKSIVFSSLPPGEAQSTVVAPGLKSQCSAGRFVFTNDQWRPPSANAVRLRDLTGPNNTITSSAFGSIPLAAGTFLFGTNDHDVLTMPNGDVILVWGVHLASPLNPKPAWFDVTTFNPATPTQFGPGVRRGSMVFKSVDCGQTFQYMATLDPATIADGSCALPKGGPPWYKNGGSDGQLAMVDAAANRLVLMFPCVGFKPDSSKSGFALSATALDKTMVMTSANEGAAWSFVGWDQRDGWRYQVVPLPQDVLATAIGDMLYFGKKLANGTYQFEVSPTIPQPPQGGWTNPWILNNPLLNGASKVIQVNVAASTVMTRSPDGANRLVLAFYDTVRGADNKLVRGFRVTFYDATSKQFAEIAPIEPVNRTTNSFIMHLGAVDPGSGPILLYWTDVDAENKRGVVRGRLIVSASEFTNDFPLSRHLVSVDPTQAPSVSTSRYFQLGTAYYWYGDYQTAFGYISGAASDSVHYFPMWVEPDKTVRYIHVLANKVPQSTALAIPIRKYIPKWHPSVPPVEAARLRLRKPEMVDRDQVGPSAISPLLKRPTTRSP